MATSSGIKPLFLLRVLLNLFSFYNDCDLFLNLCFLCYTISLFYFHFRIYLNSSRQKLKKQTELLDFGFILISLFICIDTDEKHSSND